ATPRTEMGRTRRGPRLARGRGPGNRPVHAAHHHGGAPVVRAGVGPLPRNVPGRGGVGTDSRESKDEWEEQHLTTARQTDDHVRNKPEFNSERAKAIAAEELDRWATEYTDAARALKALIVDLIRTRQ